MSKRTCECSDTKCPHCNGGCPDKATYICRRVDMEDETGTLMCEDCASDAMESGVFDCDEIDDVDPRNPDGPTSAENTLRAIRSDCERFLEGKWGIDFADLLQAFINACDEEIGK